MTTKIEDAVRVLQERRDQLRFNASHERAISNSRCAEEYEREADALDIAITTLSQQREAGVCTDDGESYAEVLREIHEHMGVMPQDWDDALIYAINVSSSNIGVGVDVADGFAHVVVRAGNRIIYSQAHPAQAASQHTDFGHIAQALRDYADGKVGEYLPESLREWAGQVDAMDGNAVTGAASQEGEDDCGEIPRELWEWLVKREIAPDDTDGKVEWREIVDALTEHEANLLAIPHPAGDRVREMYEELLYAVSQKHPGESRHETALRYIRQAESQDHGPAAALSQPANGDSHG